MDITEQQLAAVARAAEAARLDFVRVFGSTLTQPAGARDMDLAIGARTLGVEELSRLGEELERALSLPVDLIQLRAGMSPTLVREIACRSRALWEGPSGRVRYAEIIDRLMAVAEDDLLSCPPALRSEAFHRAQERLRDA